MLFKLLFLLFTKFIKVVCNDFLRILGRPHLLVNNLQGLLKSILGGFKSLDEALKLEELVDHF